MKETGVVALCFACVAGSALLGGAGTIPALRAGGVIALLVACIVGVGTLLFGRLGR